MSSKTADTKPTSSLCIPTFGTAFRLLLEPFNFPSDREGAALRCLYRTENAATRAIISWILAREGNTFRATMIRGALAPDMEAIPVDLNAAILAACRALGAARSGEPGDALERTLTATSGTATRAALRAWKAGGDAALAEHDRRSAALRPLALDWERKSAALKGERPF